MFSWTKSLTVEQHFSQLGRNQNCLTAEKPTRIPSSSTTHLSIFLLVFLGIALLSGCSAKGYSGPELPDEKLATIALKAPPTAFVPIFWIFPLNMLNWLADDWYETSWTGATITANDIELNRFNSVNVLPGTGTVKLKQYFFINQTSDGPRKCSEDSCTCIETQVNGTTKRTCEKRCETRMVTIGHERNCHINLSTDRGRRYEAFIRNDYLKIEDVENKRTLSADCELSPELRTYFTETSSLSCTR